MGEGRGGGGGGYVKWAITILDCYFRKEYSFNFTHTTKHDKTRVFSPAGIQDNFKHTHLMKWRLASVMFDRNTIFSTDYSLQLPLG